MKRLYSKLPRGNAGFTITEMLVGITLAAIASAVLYSVFISTQGLYTDNRGILETQSDSRIVMGMISQEIRSAGADVQEIGVQRLMITTPDSIRVQSDLNSDGVITSAEPAEDILYYYDSAAEALVRSTGAGAMEVLRDLKAFQFQFLDSAGNVLAPPLEPVEQNAVRAVRVMMDVEVTHDAIRTFDQVITFRNDSPGS